MILYIIGEKFVGEKLQKVCQVMKIYTDKNSKFIRKKSSCKICPRDKIFP